MSIFASYTLWIILLIYSSIKYKEKQLIYKVLEEIKKHNKNKNIKLEIDFNPIRV